MTIPSVMGSVVKQVDPPPPLGIVGMLPVIRRWNLTVEEALLNGLSSEDVAVDDRNLKHDNYLSLETIVV